MPEILGIVNNNAGIVVSLNQRAMPFFGIGMDKNTGNCRVWLSPKAWCALLPVDLTQEEANQVRVAINKGLLVEGRRYMPAVVKDTTVLNKYIEIVKTSHVVDKKAKDPFIALVLNKQEGNYTAGEIITACIKFEEGRSRRPIWMAFLNDAFKNYDGPLTLIEDYSNSPDAYDPGNPIEPVAVAPVVTDTPSTQAPKQKLSPKEKEKALNKFLDN